MGSQGGPRGARRVAITGVGAVTPIGVGVEPFWRGVCAGRSAVREVTRWDPCLFRSGLAAEVDDAALDPLAYVDRKRSRRLDRFSLFAVVAARQAVLDARLESDAWLREQSGCYVGSALGGIAFAEQQHDAFRADGPGAVNPLLALAVFGGAAPTNVAIELGWRGPCQANSNSCASGTVAVGEAFRLVRDGAAPAMLAGGAEAPLAPLTFGSFALMKAMSARRDGCPEQAYRPFDASRDGFVMGEGAAMLLLEELEHARARGARVYAEVLGYATTSDAHHMLAPLPDGAEGARAVRLALQDARLAPAAVEYVNAHASGTLLGDRAEAAALLGGLGDHAATVPVSGTKGLYGHPLGASGAIEVALCALALQRGFLPGTANLKQPDHDSPLGGLLGPGGRHARAAVALSTSFGFGGINAALLLGRVEE